MVKKPINVISTSRVNPCPAELVLIFCHLKLELLTQFPASNNKKCLYFFKYTSSKLSYLTN